MIGDRSLVLFVHGVTVEAWAKRWDLLPCTSRCGSCGTEQRTTRPFVYKQLRGLMAEPCKCSDPRVQPPYCLVRDPKYGDLFSGAK